MSHKPLPVGHWQTTYGEATMTIKRVVTRDFGDKYTVMFEGTRAQCRAFILGRWGHWPPFAAITQRTGNFHHITF